MLITLALTIALALTFILVGILTLVAPIDVDGLDPYTALRHELHKKH